MGKRDYLDVNDQDHRSFKKRKHLHDSGTLSNGRDDSNGSERSTGLREANGTSSSRPKQDSKPQHVAPSLELLEDLLQQITSRNGQDTPLLDGEALQHAQRLQEAIRRRKPEVSASIASLDAQLPERLPHNVMSAYRPNQRLITSDGLPPLPPVRNPELETAAFSHSSAASGAANKACNVEQSYERLEFLGDAYIEIISTRIIFSRFSTLPSGRQAQIREMLVKNETLAEYARGYGFDKRVRFGGQNTMAKPKNWTKILADVFEAYVAALILSNPETGITEAEVWLTNLWAEKLLSLHEKPVLNPSAKIELANKLLSDNVKLEYKEEKPMEVDRKRGKQTYHLGVYLTGWGFADKWLGSGTGQNKVQAGTYAAADALERNRELIESINQKRAENRKKREHKEGKEGMSNNA